MYTIKKTDKPLLNTPSGHGMGTDLFFFIIFHNKSGKKKLWHFNAFLAVQLKMPSILEHFY